MGKLDGKVAIVTGAGRGLGRAYARRLAGLGAKIAVIDINLKSFEEFDNTWDSIEDLVKARSADAYVAIENLLTDELKPWRVALVFSFGLLHGMGFAGVLKDVGLPRSQFLAALVSFNVGVEAGQLTVIAIALAAVSCWRRNRPVYRRLIVQPASLAIALLGLFWTLQRALG